MHIKAFKINEVNINIKLLLTKSESIALCKKENHKVRKTLLRHIAQQLMEIPEIKDNVGDQHIKFPEPSIDHLSEQIKNENLLLGANEPSNV